MSFFNIYFFAASKKDSFWEVSLSNDGSLQLQCLICMLFGKTNTKTETLVLHVSRWKTRPTGPQWWEQGRICYFPPRRNVLQESQYGSVPVYSSSARKCQSLTGHLSLWFENWFRLLSPSSITCEMAQSWGKPRHQVHCFSLLGNGLVFTLPVLALWTLLVVQTRLFLFQTEAQTLVPMVASQARWCLDFISPMESYALGCEFVSDEWHCFLGVRVITSDAVPGESNHNPSWHWCVFICLFRVFFEVFFVIIFLPICTAFRSGRIQTEAIVACMKLLLCAITGKHLINALPASVTLFSLI